MKPTTSSCYDFTSSDDEEPVIEFRAEQRRKKPLDLNKAQVLNDVASHITTETISKPVSNTAKKDASQPLNTLKKTKGRENWKQEKLKRSRLLGEAYNTLRNNIPVPAKVFREPNPNKPCCKKRRCLENIPRPVQERIRKEYVDLEDYTLRRAYINKLVLESAPKRHRG